MPYCNVLPYVLITSAGLTYFLTAVERDGGEAFLDTYLRKHPECTHLVQPLSWDKQKRNRDVVRNKNKYIGSMCDGDGGVCVCCVKYGRVFSKRVDRHSPY